MGGNKPLGADLLRLAHARGLLSAAELEICLATTGDPIHEAVRRGYLNLEDLESLGLMRFVSPAAAPSSDSDPDPDADTDTHLPPDTGFWDNAQGRRFGRYLLQAKVGEGATACVFLAHDENLNRPVALKILKESGAAAPSHLERFNREARAMARLRHPNIVAVHEIGVEQGWFYFAMDYVKGPSLAEVLKDRHVSLVQRLTILEKVARACHFAHENGVIHRDLKPGNILVDESLEPFVTDFGIARLDLEREKLTHTGTILGTAHYMSPEHITGDPDRIEPRSDVFSLGSIAYEAVTGRLAFDGTSLMAIFTAISSEDPPRPRSIQPDLAPDVEAVVMKALDKDLSRRYLTALAFAEDIAHLREGRPIKATRVSAVLMLTRRLRKHRWTAGSVAIAAAAVAALGVFAILGALRRGDDEAQGDREVDLEKKLGHYERAGATEKADAVRRQLVAVRDQARALEFKRALRERLEPRVARCRSRIEEARRLRGENARTRAGEIASEAARELRACVDEDSAWTEAWISLAQAHQIAGRSREALETLDEAIEKAGGAAPLYIERSRLNLTTYWRRRGLPTTHYYGRRAVIGEMTPETDELAALRTRVEEDLARIRASKFEFGRKHEALLEGGLLVIQGQYERGDALLAESIELDEYEILAWHYRGVGRYLRERFKEAEQDWTSALGLSLAESEHALYRGMARQAQNNLDGALEDYRRATELDPSFASAWNSVGNVQLSRRRYRDALEAFDKAIELSPRSAFMYSNRGNVHFNLRDYDRAIADHTRAIEISPGYASAYSNRGNSYHGRGDEELALADHTRAVELAPRVALFWNNRGVTLVDLGRIEDAIEDYTRAIEADPEFSLPYSNRAGCRLRLGDIPGAIEDFERHAMMSSWPTSSHVRLGELYRQIGKPALAVEHYLKALERSPRNASVLVALGDARSELGDWESAIGDYSRALNVDRRSAAAFAGRGIARARLGDSEGGHADLDRAVELNARDARSRLERGVLRLADGRFVEAATDLEEALQLAAPDWSERERALKALLAARAGRRP